MKIAEDLALAALESEKQRRRQENRLAYYKPYALQAKFHAAGATHRERLLMAGNQLGKTLGWRVRGGHARDRPLSRLVGGPSASTGRPLGGRVV
jgi:hypothetical protein